MFDQITENLILTDSMFLKQREYWINKMSGDILKTGFLADDGKSHCTHGNRKKVDMLIPADQERQLLKVSRKTDPSLYLVLLTALKSLIYNYTENEDIIVISPIYQPHAHEHTLNDRVFIRNRVNGEMTLRELLLEIRQSTLEAYEQQDYPYEKLIHYLTSNRVSNSQSLSDICCLLQNIHDDGIEVPLVFSFTREDEHLKGCIIYQPGVYEDDFINRLVRHFVKSLEIFLKDSSKKIAGISFLSEEEKKQLILNFNNTGVTYPEDKTLQQLFVEQVEKTPGHTALVYSDQRLSYRELDKRTNQLAHLLKEKGIIPGGIAALMIMRSPEMIIAILAILKAGGAYLAVDPVYPRKRITYMLGDSQAGILLIQNSLLELLDLEKVKFQGEIIQLDNRDIYSGESSNPALSGNPHDIAYIIYTSGSTGNPKGVMIEHTSAVNLAYTQKEEFKIDETDRIMQFSPIAFDASVEQIFIAFFSGAILFLVDKDTLLNKDKFAGFLLEYQITHIHAVPSFLNTIDVNDAYSLKRIIAGGDVCPVQLARRWYKKYDFYNEYGPTETTVTSIELLVKDIDDNLSQLPIGKPLNNTQVYILDRWMRLAPPGAVGELYIGGVGVARGYLNNPEMTAEKFLSAPHWAYKSYKAYFPKKIYRTGDLARWRRDRNIEFLGRIDFQVKVRGNRIELGEIENTLLNYGKRPLNRTIPGPLAGKETARCSTCLLSANYPQIHFDEKGICNICYQYKEYSTYAQSYFRTPEDFHRLVEKARQTRRGEYDCLLLFSGGKDSSYVLYRLVDLGLKVMAFTFDNGYISEVALENIKRITSKLKVDSIVGKAPRMAEIFAASLDLEHTVCTGCFKALTAISTQIAANYNINMVITGLSRGQIFDTKLYGLFKQQIFDAEEIENKLLIFRKMYHSPNDQISKLLNINLEETIFDQVYFLDFFRYDATPAPGIWEFLKTRDLYWKKPGDTGLCSTNCRINDVGIYVHQQETGYHNYEAPLSWDCRLGQGNRQEMLKEIESPVDLPRVEKILHEIGYGEKRINAAVVLDREDKTGEKYLCAYLVSQREIDIPHLKKYLSASLPDYMVPDYFVRLAKLPVTSNGKVDRKALPHPEIKPGTQYIPPRNEIEKRLVKIWAKILHLDQNVIGIDHNFFELGGTSLDIIKINGELQETFQREVPVITMFRYTTVHSLAGYLKEEEKAIRNRKTALKKGKNNIKMLRKRKGVKDD